VRAIRFEAFGDPSVLKVAEVPVPTADEKAALVRVVAASTNPSDVQNVAGVMRQITSPRIPGRDFAGIVEAGPSRMDRSRGLGHGRRRWLYPRRNPPPCRSRACGASRTPSASMRRHRSASIYVAAWCGIDATSLKAGETVLLIGAGGGVGAAAAQIARRLGARVIGADNRMPHPDAPIQAIAEKLIIGAEDVPAEVRAATGGKGAEVVLDLVGGVMFLGALKSLALRGRLVESPRPASAK
jgi:NADPH2:quinone reductase